MIRVGYFVPGYRRFVDPAVWRQGVMEGIAAAHLGQYRLEPIWDDCNGIDLARNRTLEEARDVGLDFLFMQDSDTYVPTLAVIPRLLQIADAHEAAVVAIGYPLRRETPTLSVVPTELGAVYQCDSAGTGLMLIRIADVDRVAEDYDGPWFDRSYADKRQTKLGEGGDFHFCRVMREHGCRIFADTEIPTEHVVARALSYEGKR